MKNCSSKTTCVIFPSQNNGTHLSISESSWVSQFARKQRLILTLRPPHQEWTRESKEATGWLPSPDWIEYDRLGPPARTLAVARHADDLRVVWCGVVWCGVVW